MPSATFKSQTVFILKFIKKRQCKQLQVFCMSLKGFLIMKEQRTYVVFVPYLLYILFLLFLPSPVKSMIKII